MVCGSLGMWWAVGARGEVSNSTIYVFFWPFFFHISWVGWCGCVGFGGGPGLGLGFGSGRWGDTPPGCEGSGFGVGSGMGAGPGLATGGVPSGCGAAPGSGFGLGPGTPNTTPSTCNGDPTLTKPTEKQRRTSELNALRPQPINPTLFYPLDPPYSNRKCGTPRALAMGPPP